MANPTQQAHRAHHIALDSVETNFMLVFYRILQYNRRDSAEYVLRTALTISSFVGRIHMAETNSIKKSSRFKDRTGQRSGFLVVISLNRTDKKRAHWNCRCDCGKEVVVSATALQQQTTRSCGCWSRLVHQKHGYARGKPPRIYLIYNGMRNRCENKNHRAYDSYGGRGIIICERWSGINGIRNFESDMGDPPPGLTLERIDNNGPYSPENCKWASITEQARNRRNNRLIFFNGKEQCATVWSIETGINKTTLHYRLGQGWGVEKSLTTPVSKQQQPVNKRIEFNGKIQGLAAWAREFGIKQETLFSRLRHGWTIERALTEPIQHHQLHASIDGVVQKQANQEPNSTS